MYGLLDVGAALEADAAPIPVTRIDVTPTAASLKVNDTVRLNAVLTPENATNVSVVWSTSEPDIASVDGNTGLVRGLAVGEAVITATALGGENISARADITVTNSTPTPDPGPINPDPVNPAPPTPSPSPSPGPSQKSGGGCNTSLGVAALALGIFILSRQRAR
jgi:hypothetical protein